MVENASAMTSPMQSCFIGFAHVKVFACDSNNFAESGFPKKTHFQAFEFRFASVIGRGSRPTPRELRTSASRDRPRG